MNPGPVTSRLREAGKSLNLSALEFSHLKKKIETTCPPSESCGEKEMRSCQWSITVCCNCCRRIVVLAMEVTMTMMMMMAMVVAME